MSPVRDIANLTRSVVRRKLTDRALTSYLTRRIGPEGIVGAKNYDTNYSRIGSMVARGQQGEAEEYANKQEAMVKGGAARQVATKPYSRLK